MTATTVVLDSGERFESSGLLSEKTAFDTIIKGNDYHHIILLNSKIIKVNDLLEL